MGKDKAHYKQPAKKKPGKPPIIFYSIIGIVVICLIGLAVFAKHSQGDVKTSTTTSKPVSIDTTNQPYLGKASAPVSIVEFGDYKCPYCKQFTENYVPNIEKDFIKTGKAKFYFINFPFINTDSTRAAEFAETIYKELGTETFWKFHEKLYKAQPEGQQYEKQDVYTEDFLTNILKQVASSDQVTTVVDAFHKKVYEDALSKDMDLAYSTGINQTPSVFVNGVYFNPGASNYSAFTKLVNKEAKEQ